MNKPLAISAFVLAAGGAVVGGLLSGGERTLDHWRATLIECSPVPGDPDELKVRCLKRYASAKDLLEGLCWPECVEDTGELLPVETEECDSPTRDTYKAAVAEKEAERLKCPGGIIQEGLRCVCSTKEEMVEGEIIADEIPIEQRRRKVLRCGHVDPETKTKSNVVLTEPWSVPVGTGIVLVDNLVLDASMDTRTKLDEDVQKLCCADCPDECWMSPRHWGACPACLCDGSCKDHCPKTEK